MFYFVRSFNACDQPVCLIRLFNLFKTIFCYITIHSHAISSCSSDTTAFVSCLLSFIRDIHLFHNLRHTQSIHILSLQLSRILTFEIQSRLMFRNICITSLPSDHTLAQPSLLTKLQVLCCSCTLQFLLLTQKIYFYI